MTKKTWFALALAAVAIAIGIVGWMQFFKLSDRGDNQALVDNTTTAEVQAEVSRGLQSVLSYDHADPKPTEQAADQLLSGKARTEYDRLFADLNKQAPGQKLVLTASVAASAVSELTDKKATLLVFIDQSSRRAKDKEASVSAAQLKITAERQPDGRWTISELKPL